MADATQPVLPAHTAVFGLALFATVALPLFGEHSMLAWILAIAERDPLAGLLACFTWGSPFMFGVAVAIASALRRPESAAVLLLVSLRILLASLLVFALALSRAPNVKFPLLFLGFMIVNYFSLVATRADAQASDRPIHPRTYVRWGGVALTGTTLWLHFQTVDGRPLGVAIHVALAASFLLAATLPRARTDNP